MTPTSRPMSRRAVLAGLGAAAVGSFAIARGSAPSWALASTGASPGDWADLARQVRGTLLMPSSPEYQTARLGWNTIYDDVLPQAVLKAADANDVRQALAFCRDTGVRPTPRSGGHSFQGFSTSTGLLIDLSALDSVRVSKDRERVRIGAGALLIDIYAKMAKQGRMAIAGGTCPLVGISGLTQGGGIGPFSREYGLTLDRLLSADIVTANGRLQRVSAHANPDLFWAIRGGGGGNFGVVTSFEFAPIPADMTINSTTMTFAWADAARVLAAFQTWPEALPATAHPNLVIVTSEPATGAQPQVTVSLWFRGSRPRNAAVIRDFIAEVGASPISQQVVRQSFFDAEWDEYCQGYDWQQCAPVTSSGGLLPRVGLATYSEISRRPWPRAANDVLLEELERWQRDPVLQPPGVVDTLQAGKVIIEPLSGAVHRTAPTATAFPHRTGWLIYQFQSRVRPGAPQEVVAAGQAWVTNLFERLTPWRTGDEYSNYGNRALRGWGEAYYGENLARLRSVKAEVDPRNLFRFEQSVRPSKVT